MQNEKTKMQKCKFESLTLIGKSKKFMEILFELKNKKDVLLFIVV